MHYEKKHRYDNAQTISENDVQIVLALLCTFHVHLVGLFFLLESYASVKVGRCRLLLRKEGATQPFKNRSPVLGKKHSSSKQFAPKTGHQP